MTARIVLGAFWSAFSTGIAVTMLTGGVTGLLGVIVITGLLIFAMVLISITVRMMAGDAVPLSPKHRHTFGPWETSWYLNENGSKAQVCEQIQKCTGCGYIKRRKP